MKKCPFCAEYIQDEAIKCRYCGSRLDGSADRGFMPGGDAEAGIQNEAAGLLAGGRKIDAIRLVRERKGLGLAQAKAYVEALGTGGDPNEAAQRPVGTNRGCALVLALILIGIAAGVVVALMLLGAGGG